jgi:hypothetical protein
LLDLASTLLSFGMPNTVTAKWDYSDSEYSCYYSMFVPIRYAMSKKLGHLFWGVSSVCKSDNFDSWVFMLLLLLVCGMPVGMSERKFILLCILPFPYMV